MKGWWLFFFNSPATFWLRYHGLSFFHRRPRAMLAGRRDAPAERQAQCSRPRRTGWRSKRQERANASIRVTAATATVRALAPASLFGLALLDLIEIFVSQRVQRKKLKD
jgi:hypothetical protein